MDEVVKKVRKKRTVDPMKRIVAIDKKIAALEVEKEELMKPIKTKQLLDEAVKTMSPEEIAAKLGINFE